MILYSYGYWLASNHDSPTMFLLYGAWIELFVESYMFIVIWKQNKFLRKRIQEESELNSERKVC